MQVRATHRVPPTAALVITCIACAHACMNRTQIHTLQHSSRTSELPSPTMRHFTTTEQQAFQTLPTLTTHSLPHIAPHGTLGSPTMSLSTTHNEPTEFPNSRIHRMQSLPTPDPISNIVQHFCPAYFFILRPIAPTQRALPNDTHPNACIEPNEHDQIARTT